MMNARRTDPQGSNHVNERHDVCLKATEWREVHDFIAGTKEYREQRDANLDKKIDDLTLAVSMNYGKNEKRIRSLENFRYYAAGAVAVIVVVLIPVALKVIW